MKFKVRYLQDFHITIKEVIIECNSNNEEDIKKAVDEYYDKNLSHLEEINGAVWAKVENE